MRGLQLWVVGLGLVVQLGCQPEAELVDADCAGIECNPCGSSDQCVVLHNPCHEVATCANRDDPFAVTQEGCSKALEYGTPPDSACECVDTWCTSE